MAGTLPVVFPAFIILDAIHSVNGLHPLKTDLRNFLLAQVSSANATVNWWQRGTNESKVEPYPDDLDDTSCTWAALTNAFPSAITSNVLAKLTHVLTALESQEGGPYVTWTVPKASPQKLRWSDVDPVVNSNIAYFLGLNNVFLPNVIRYLADALNVPFTSPYYPSLFPVLYFFSRFYAIYAVSVGNKNLLRDVAQKAVRWLSTAMKKDTHDAQDTALAASALLRFDPTAAHSATVSSCLTRLATQQKGGCWPEGKLCVHTHKNGVMKTAGSPAVTTALCLETFTLYTSLHKPLERQESHIQFVNIYTKTLQLAADECSKPIAGKIAQTLESLKTSRTFQTTIMFPYLCRDTVFPEHKCPIKTEALDGLAAATTLGWAAYTIADNIRDGDADSVEWTPVFNSAVKLAHRKYSLSVPNNTWFEQRLTYVLSEMDAAQKKLAHSKTWTGKKKYLELSWKKSLGCMVSLYGILAFLPERRRGELERLFLVFFQHFIIIRQLNDDAHDWEQDRKDRQQTYATHLVGTGKIRDLRVKFWRKSIFTLCAEMEKHLLDCKKALDTMKLPNPDPWKTVLAATEQGISRTTQEAKHTQDFLSSYAKHGMLKLRHGQQPRTGTTRKPAGSRSPGNARN